MAIYTKCIFKKPEDIDGERISVMSRHTLNDGITKDERITGKSYDAWLRILAPQSIFVGAYLRKDITWKEFEKNYLLFLKEPYNILEIKFLAKKGLEKDITLLCSEETADKCHRRLLAEECQKHEPKLIVEHR